MNARRKTSLLLALLLVPATALYTSCSSSSSKKKVPAAITEAEPNDASMNALALGNNVPGRGDVALAGDVDFWSADLQAGWVIQVELFATRSDQAGWDGNANIPRLTLYDTDGTTRLLEHDYGGNTTTTGSWDWGEHDLDFPMYRVPATGTYYLAVTQDDTTVDGGEYVVRWSRLNVGPIQFEAEPRMMTGMNDDFMTAQAISPGTVCGYHVDDEDDYYSFTVGANGAIVEFEIYTYRNGVYDGDDDSTDSYLYLYDTDGVTELFSDDDSWFYDSAIQYAIVNPGTYYLNVTECCGQGDSGYLLTFNSIGLGGVADETEPNDTTMTANAGAYGLTAVGYIDAADTDFYRFSGTAGDMVRLQAFDVDNAQDVTEDIDFDLFAPDGVTQLSTGGDDDLQTKTTILQETGTFYVRVTSPFAVGISPYGVRLWRYQAARYETEPNDDVMTANALDSGRRGAGVIDMAADVDVFSFSASMDRLYVLRVYASSSPTSSDGAFEYSGHGSDLDPLLTIRDAMGVALATSTSDPTSVYSEDVTVPLPTAQVAFIAPSSGTFYVEVADAFGGFGASSYYVVELK